MRIDLPTSSIAAGFSNEPSGTHTSRTLMLPELSAVLGAASSSATYAEYADAIVADNVLLKATEATRRKSLRHLRELYALNTDVPLFAAMRALWPGDIRGQPLIAFICAVARDPLLRSTVDLVLSTNPGQHVETARFSESVGRAFPGRFSSGVLARIGRNVASSWTQSRHLTGRVSKVRSRASATDSSVAYGLYVSNLAGDTGSGLFRSVWSQLNDVPELELRDLGQTASRLGWISYRSAAGMTEVTFRQLDALTRRPGHDLTA